MLELSQILFFISTSAVLIVMPGPDIIFTITQGISNGRRAGVMTGFGFAFGNLVHTFAAVLGISVIFKTSAIAFTVFKILGALYLFYLAFKIFKNKASVISLEQQEKKNEGNIKLMSRGFILNVLNPKVALFFLMLFPQFVNPSLGNVILQTITLGLIFIVLVMIIFGLCGFFAGSAGDWLTKRPGFNKGIGYVAAFIYIAIAVQILFIKA